MDYHANQGDIVWMNFDPQVGHEQKGRRPALIVSNNRLNRFEQVTAMVCPITNTDRSIPIQINLDGRTKTSGVIMCDQAKILDLKERNAEFIESVPEDIIFEAVDIISGFLEMI
ncbi:MAG: type II toxin-antitoxin system PemK/MazF family toxin [Oscillospiraceae bacterium]|jgi:mRNA interferase MazF|nr:type II toxin-antitoxin system PemK/MazF family toxin [Oscillospiraceae bacterium]